MYQLTINCGTAHRRYDKVCKIIICYYGVRVMNIIIHTIRYIVKSMCILGKVKISGIRRQSIGNRFIYIRIRPIIPRRICCVRLGQQTATTIHSTCIMRNCLFSNVLRHSFRNMTIRLIHICIMCLIGVHVRSPYIIGSYFRFNKYAFFPRIYCM